VAFNGPEFRVNTYTNGPQQTFFQTPEAVAMNTATGDYVVTWSSQNQVSGSGWNVYVQRYNAAGTPQGAETLIDTPAQGNDQEYSSVAMAQNGSFVITWSGNQGGHWNVYAQLFNATGTPSGPVIQVNSTTGSDEEYPSVAMRPSGAFVITWSGHQSGQWNTYAREFNASGVPQGSDFGVSTPIAGADQMYSSVAMRNNGNFVITWSGHQSGNWDIYAQQYSASGTPSGSVFEVNTTTANDQEYSTVSMDSSGNFVITWSGHQSGHWAIYAQQFNASGAAQGSEFQVNTNIQNDREYSTIAMQPDGDFLVTWSSNNQDGSGWGIFAQAYTAGGVALGSEFQVNTFTQGDQEFSSVAADGTGQYVVVWSSNNEDGNSWGVYGQQLLSSNILVTPSAGLETTRAGGTATFQVVLSQLPLGLVTVPLSSSDTGEGTVNPSSLLFTTLNWNVAQTVTVTGVNDGTSGNVNYTIMGGPATSTDPSYSGAIMPTVYVTNTGATPTPRIVVTSTVNDNAFVASVDNAVELLNSATGAVIASFPTGVPNDGVALGPDGSIYVADYYNNQVLHYDAAGNLLSSFGAAKLISPQGLSFGPDGNLYVTCTNGPNNGFVDEFSPTGTFLGAFISPGSGGLSNAKAIVWGPDGNAYVSSYFNSEVIRYNGTTGAFMNVFASGSGGFEGLAFGPDGNLYVASYGDNAIERFNGTTGASLGAFVSGGNLVTPYGLRFDQAGNLDVASQSVGQIQTYSGTTGAFLGNLATGLTNPSFMTGASTLVTSETGTSAAFTVALDSQPAANVTVTLTNGNAGQGTLSQSTLTFTPTNWNLAQTVTVTGVDDYVVNGNQTYRITGSASSSDANYNGMTMTPLIVTNTEADVAGINVTPVSLTTSESGTSTSFTVSLTSEPVAPVTITLTNGNPGQGSLLQSTLTFTASNWNVAQTVMVTGLDDHIVNGNQTYKITGTASSSDANYNGMSMTPVTVTNTEADVAGISVTPGALTTSESGTTASFSVNLTSEPVAQVTITLTNGNAGQGSLSQSTLTFNASNWNVSQTVLVTGLDDHIVNGNQTYQITGSAASSDSNYNGMMMTPVTVTNTEADVAGIHVGPAALTTSESGTTDDFKVRLTSQPLAPVTITLTNGNPGQGSLSQSTLTFNASNWNVPQTVTVTGLDDHIVNGNQTYQITGSASSGDSNYNGMTVTPVTVTNTEADVAGINVTPTSGLVTSGAGGTATFDVVLTSQPLAGVTIGVSSSNTNEATVAQPSLTFTPANWNIPQTVTVTGVNDHTSGSQPFTVFLSAASSLDPVYNGMKGSNVTGINYQIVPAGINVSSQSLQTTESGGSARFHVTLATQPSATVTISLNSTNPGQGSLSQSTLTFNTANWNVPQTVVVTGLDDHIVNGNQTYQITGSAASSASNYNGMSMPPVTVTNTEADVARIEVSPGALITSESGTTASFSVALTSIPGAPVTITLTNGNPGQGSLSQSTLTFIASNWNVPQPVTVTGLDDHIVNGDQTYQITLSATSSDSNYNGRNIPPVTVTNTEADVAGINVGSGALTTSESGTTASFSVSLTSAPVAPVTITLNNGNPGQGSLSQSTLTFDASQWNVPQTVVVTGLDDHIVNGDQTYQINGAAASTDANYDARAMTPITVTNKEADVAGFTIAPDFLTTTGAGSQASFNVALNSEPLAPVTITLAANPSVGALSQTVLVFTPGTWNAAQAVTVTSVGAPSGGGVLTYQIVGAAASPDATYNARAVSPVTVTDHTPAPPVPAPPVPAPTVIATATPDPVVPPTTIASLYYAVKVPLGIVPAAIPVSTPADSVTPTTTGDLSLPAALQVSNPIQGTYSALTVFGRAVSVFQAVPAEALIEVPPPKVAAKIAAPPAPAQKTDLNELDVASKTRRDADSEQAGLASEAQVFAELRGSYGGDAPGADADEILAFERRDDAERENSVLAATGIAATAGYVLFNTRAGLWLLSVLATRPLWKQFDPLEILYSWEKRAVYQPQDEGDEEESLASLVE